MQLSDIRRAFFGCRKNDVYRYIAEISGEFSARLKAVEETNEKRFAALEAEKTGLQENIAELTSENEKFKAQETAIAESIIEAKLLAERIVAEAEAEAARCRAEVENEVALRRAELEREIQMSKRKAEAMISGVAACKNEIERRLEKMRADLSDTESMVYSATEGTEEEADDDISEESGSGDYLTLFRSEGSKNIHEKTA